MSERRPRVTTIVPTFRRPDLLRRALESVALQTFGDYEVFVYDNASGDRTEDVVREFAARDPRIHYFAHPENIGAERNFRYGLEHAETELISFLSDDDFLMPSLYELTVASLDAHPDAAMACTSVVHVNKVGTFAREPALAPGCYPAGEGLVAMLRRTQPTWTGTMFRRAAVTEAGGLDDSSVIDLDLELRLAGHNSVVILSETGAVLTSENHFGKCLDWLERFEVTIRKLEADTKLPAEVRQLAGPSLRRRLEAMVFLTGIVATRMGRPDLSRKAARVLSEEFGDRGKSFIVGTMALAGGLAPRVAPVLRKARSAIGRPRDSTSEILRNELRMMAPSLFDRAAAGS